MEHRSGALEGVSLGGGGDSPGFSEDLHPRRSSSLQGDVLQQHVQRQDFHPVNVAYNAHTHLPTPGTAGLYDNNPAAAAAAMMNMMNNMGNVHSQQQQQGGGFNTPPHATSRGRAAAAGGFCSTTAIRRANLHAEMHRRGVVGAARGRGRERHGQRLKDQGKSTHKLSKILR